MWIFEIVFHEHESTTSPVGSSTSRLMIPPLQVLALQAAGDQVNRRLSEPVTNGREEEEFLGLRRRL